MPIGDDSIIYPLEHNAQLGVFTISVGLPVFLEIYSMYSELSNPLNSVGVFQGIELKYACNEEQVCSNGRPELF